ncbi:MAG: hypothetical protein KY433_07710, partial [Actinobacteria bacterium]|nr:hypothetical protein [Actinomycetota bacterium]
MRAASVVFLAAPLALCGISSAQAQRSSSSADDRPWSTDGGRSMVAPWPGSRSSRSSFSRPTPAQQHGGFADHLPPARENVELVSKLELTAPFGNVLPGQIADVAVHRQAAYLTSWAVQDDPAAPCRRGGFFSVDISNPAAPVQRAFVPALPQTYHGEGAHATAINTPAFRGDLLAVNNEPCGRAGVGGFDLYDVSDPANPVTLIQGEGDRSPDDTTEAQDPDAVPNASHSIFVWQDGPRAYAVTVDNTELHDVDIFDITNPRAPEFIADLDLVELFPQIVANSANGNTIFLHDMVVKRVGGTMRMLLSYWDGGYVQLDVSDPANPTYITDTNFPDVEPLVDLPAPSNAPEGNAHQAEYSHDGEFILAADEDFSTSRAVFEITEGPHAGRSAAGEFSFSLPISTLPDGRLNGPTVYGGYGCSALDEIPPAAEAFAGVTLAPGEERILVVQRGQQLASMMQSFSGRLDETANYASRRLELAVTDVNRLAGQIATVNAEIVGAEANGQTATDLRDRRDLEVAERQGERQSPDVAARPLRVPLPQLLRGGRPGVGGGRRAAEHRVDGGIAVDEVQGEVGRRVAGAPAVAGTPVTCRRRQPDRRRIHGVQVHERVHQRCRTPLHLRV